MEILHTYVNYNIWANKMLLDLIIKDYSELLDTEVDSSFKSLRKTIFHIWDAEYIWKRRIQGESIADFPSKQFNHTTDLNLFIENSISFKELIFQTKDLQKIIGYKKNTYKCM